MPAAAALFFFLRAPPSNNVACVCFSRGAPARRPLSPFLKQPPPPARFPSPPPLSTFCHAWLLPRARGWLPVCSVKSLLIAAPRAAAQLHLAVVFTWGGCLGVCRFSRGREREVWLRGPACVISAHSLITRRRQGACAFAGRADSARACAPTFGAAPRVCANPLARQQDHCRRRRSSSPVALERARAARALDPACT